MFELSFNIYDPELLGQFGRNIFKNLLGERFVVICPIFHKNILQLHSASAVNLLHAHGPHLSCAPPPFALACSFIPSPNCHHCWHHAPWIAPSTEQIMQREKWSRVLTCLPVRRLSESRSVELRKQSHWSNVFVVFIVRLKSALCISARNSSRLSSLPADLSAKPLPVNTAQKKKTQKKADTLKKLMGWYANVPWVMTNPTWKNALWNKIFPCTVARAWILKHS